MDAFHEARERVERVMQLTLSLKAALEPDRGAGAKAAGAAFVAIMLD